MSRFVIFCISTFPALLYGLCGSNQTVEDARQRDRLQRESVEFSHGLGDTKSGSV